jgi:hypothetical protein
MMAPIVSTATRMAPVIGMTNRSRMANRSRPRGRGVIEVFLMATEVVMFFIGMMGFKIRVIAAIAPGIGRVSIDRIARVTVAISAAISAIKASA